MRFIFKLILSSALILGTFFNSLASGIGTTSANFLKIGVGARAISMGEAFTALADDGTSIYWNPAGLVHVQKRELLVMYNTYFKDINQGYVSLISNSRFGKIGLGINYIHIGNIEGTDEQGNFIGDFSSSNFNLSLAYANYLTSVLKFGISAGIIHDAIMQDIKTALHANIGFLFNMSRLLSFGLVFQNIGSKLGEDPLPFTFRGGVAVNFKHIILDVDIAKPLDNSLYFCSGIEYKTLNVLALRFGYKFGNSIGPGISMGAGLNMNKISVNYAYVPYGELGNMQRISMSFEF